MVSLAAEFPNDNPDLHAGVIWVCRDVTGPALPERISHDPPVAAVDVDVAEVIAQTVEEAIAPRESGIFVAAAAEDTFEFEEEDEILVEEMTPFEAIAVEMVAPPSETKFVCEGALAAIEEQELAACEPPPSTVILPPVEATVTTDPWLVFVTALVDVAVAQGAPQVASMLPAILEEDATGKAWAGILRGTSEDWDAIGGSMLDEWAADLLARQLGAADKSNALKRELRDRGVAAFGMIEAVAA